MLSSKKIIKETKKKFTLFSLLAITLVAIISYSALHFYVEFVSQQELTQDLYSRLSKQLILVNRISSLDSELNKKISGNERRQVKETISQYISELSKEYKALNTWLVANDSPRIRRVENFLAEESIQDKMKNYLESARAMSTQNSSVKNEGTLLAQRSIDDLGDILATVSYKVSLQQKHSFLKLKRIGVLFTGLCVLQIILVWLLVFRPLHSTITLQHEKLAEVLLQVRSVSRSKTDFLANISHEIRTPMTAILGYIQLLKKEKLSTEERLEHIRIVDNNAEHLMSLIDEILDISKIEAGKFELIKRRVNLSTLLNEVYSLINVKAQEKGLSLILKNEGEIPEEITGDPKRVKQLLFNIIGNAIKFTDQGSIEVSISFEKIEQKVIIRVKDTGIGISDKAKGHLFRHFEQADSSAGRLHGGTGLGLVLSRGLAREMGGDVKIIDSKVGTGTIMEISFLDDGASEDIQLVSHLSTNILELSTFELDDEILRGRRLLVVDDAKENARLFKLYLSEAGAEVEVANGGQEALTMSKNQEFDLILLDLQMPGMDGFQVIKELREDSYQKPVVALTAHAREEEKEKTRKAGFDAHITKPVKAEHLIKSVYSLISSS